MGAFCCHGNQTKSQITIILAIFKCPYQSNILTKLGTNEKQKIEFQDGPHGGHLGFLIGTILAIFDLHVTLMLPTKFQVS